MGRHVSCGEILRFLRFLASTRPVTNQRKAGIKTTHSTRRLTFSGSGPQMMPLTGQIHQACYGPLKVYSRFRRLFVRSAAWQHGRLSTAVNPFPLYRVAFQRNKLGIYTKPHMGCCSSVVVTPSIICVTLSCFVQVRLGLRLETVAIISRPMQEHRSTIRGMRALRAVTVMEA